MIQLAMFDAVNSIERKYRPYLVQLPAVEAAFQGSRGRGRRAARCSPASVRRLQAEMKAALAAYLEAIPDSAAKTDGIKLGEAVAAKILEARADDGSAAPDTYRPSTAPGVYVPTAPTWAPQWPGVKPFAMTSNSQFRPAPPIALTSKEWVADYNEIKSLGAAPAASAPPQQTEDARFWLASRRQGLLPRHPHAGRRRRS